jgi:cell wall-associated NlpC family hydrolase
VTQLLRGEPLTVTERRDAWARIRTAYGYPGWIRERALEAGSGALPPAEHRAPLELAREYLGAPYEWGGMTARGIDCSGLVHMSYRRAGRLVPRDAAEQEDAGEHVAAPDARSGDLATYGEPDKKHATHIAFWLGDGRILHSTERDGANGVVEELEPPELSARRRVFVRV